MLFVILCLVLAPSSVNVLLSVLVVDDDILEVEVGDIEMLEEFDGTVEGVSQGILVVDKVIETKFI